MQQHGSAGAMQSVRERILGAWQAVDDDDIERSGGSLEKLVDMIARKTGQPRAAVRREVRRIFSS